MNMQQAPFLADDCQPLRKAVARGEVSMWARVRGQYPGTQMPADALPGLRTIGFWDAVGPQSWGLPMHRNEGIEICYLLSGETVFATDHEERILRPGEITITRPWQRHRLGDPNIRPCRMFWVIIDVENPQGDEHWEFPEWIAPDLASRRELLRIYRANQCCHLVDTMRSLQSVLGECCGLLPAAGPLEVAHLSCIVNHLICTVALMLAKDGGKRHADPHDFDRTVHGFFRGLEASMESAAEPWTVSSMARACRVGPTYLTASCKQLFNATPSDHLIHIRLAHAANALRADHSRKIIDIAFDAGFNSSQHFATRFRQQYGMTPGAYRNRHQIEPGR